MVLDLRQRKYLQEIWKNRGITDAIIEFLIKRYLHSQAKSVRDKPPRLVKVHSREEEVQKVQSWQAEVLVQ